MRNYLHFILIYFLSSHPAFSKEKSKNIYDESYGFVAKSFVSSNLSDIEEKILNIPNNVFPHEVKTLRKDIGDARYYLDLFIYAYPKYKLFDPLLDFRDLLDEGYDAFGNFKDLFDMIGIPKDEITEGDYDLNEVRYYRQFVFQWIEKFTPEMNEFFSLYFKNPLETDLQERKKKKLPKFIWRYQKKPTVKISNFISIMKKNLICLLKKSEERYEKVVTIKDIFIHESQEDFHDFRKQVRYIVKTEKYFKNLLPELITEGISFKFLKKAVDKCGDLNDLITKQVYLNHKALSLGPLEAIATLAEIIKLKNSIKEDWRKFLAWQKENKLKLHLEILKKEIRELK